MTNCVCVGCGCSCGPDIFEGVEDYQAVVLRLLDGWQPMGTNWHRHEHGGHRTECEAMTVGEWLAVEASEHPQ